MNIKGENLWHKPTPEQAQILSLAAMIQGGDTKFNNSKKNENGNADAEKSAKTNDSNGKKKDCGVTSWMLVAPKMGESKSTTKNDKEYHWCPKCADGAGQWVRHKPSEHQDNFKGKKKSTSNSGGNDESSKKKGNKNSSKNTGGSDGAPNASDNGGGSLQFNRSALLSVAAANNSDTQAFLSQFVPGNK